MTHISHKVRAFANLKALTECVGEELAVSDWVLIDQARIDTFAQATGDHQWIHVDPQRAAAGPYGTTIAHGFLTLSLLPMLMNRAISIGNVKMGLNYGLNRVRFPAPVKVGSKVRGRFKLLAMTQLAPLKDVAGFELVIEVTVESEGDGKPACIAQAVSRRYG